MLNSHGEDTIDYATDSCSRNATHESFAPGLYTINHLLLPSLFDTIGVMKMVSLNLDATKCTIAMQVFVETVTNGHIVNMPPDATKPSLFAKRTHESASTHWRMPTSLDSPHCQ